MLAANMISLTDIGKQVNGHAPPSVRRKWESREAGNWTQNGIMVSEEAESRCTTMIIPRTSCRDDSGRVLWRLAGGNGDVEVIVSVLAPGVALQHVTCLGDDASWWATGIRDSRPT